eukprot:scaffold86016_cov63-Phaeocystis_antarctica.AAC.5
MRLRAQPPWNGRCVWRGGRSVWALLVGSTCVAPRVGWEDSFHVMARSARPKGSPQERRNSCAAMGTRAKR